MVRLAVSLALLFALTPSVGFAQLQEMRQTIFGMD
jgi:hypothetical protein